MYYRRGPKAAKRTSGGIRAIDLGKEDKGLTVLVLKPGHAKAKL